MSTEELNVAADQSEEKEHSALELSTSLSTKKASQIAEHEQAQSSEASQIAEHEQAQSAEAPIEDAEATLASFFTDDDPPGPEIFAQWATHDYEDTDESGGDAKQVEAAIRNFMGPNDNHVAQMLRKRKRQQKRMDGGTTTFASVSYKQIDTPVWQNYTQSLQKDKKPRCVTWLRRIMTCMLGPKDADPIASFLADTRFVTRCAMAAIGFAVSVAGFFIAFVTEYLLNLKLQWSLSKGETEGFAVFIGWSLLFGFLAFLPVCYRPVSAGSGIAEAKAVLNGIILPCCTELKTALCKGLSLIFSSASSLPVGLEGPMIFTGLSLGENAQRFIPKTYATLLSERYRRDFAAIGTACGVTSAFLTPIGGVLFAMEEGSSFWSVLLAWRSFGAACITVVFSYIWYMIADNDRSGATFNADTLGGIFQGFQGQNAAETTSITFRVFDYFVFALMGIGGGIMGACWCEIHRALAIQSNKYFTSKIEKGIIVLVLIAGMCSLVWWMPLVYKVCSPVRANVDNLEVYHQFGCANGEYNQLAALLLNSPKVGINLLFWEPEEAFTAASCVIAGSIYLTMLLLCFGTSISMGIFIPLLFVGSCYGRALGLGLNAGEQTNTYAIVGSVAALAGVVRILISLTVIMVGATGLQYMVSPFMVATICARMTGNWLFRRPGIYHIIFDLKGIPFLEEEPPSEVEFRGLRASDLMSSPVVYLQPDMNVGVLLEMLKEYAFLDFPVMDPTRQGRLIGLITRTDILTAMSYRGLFYRKGENDAWKAVKQARLLHKRYEGPTLETVQMQIVEDDLDMFIDLTPYVEIGHYTFDENASATRAYELFRLLGLRTLIVTGPMGLPVGILTRYDMKVLDSMQKNQDRLENNRRSVAAYEMES